jgi:hypothetical protein
MSLPNNSTPPTQTAKSAAKPKLLLRIVLSTLIFGLPGFMFVRYLTGPYKREFAREQQLLEHGQPVLVEILSIRDTGSTWEGKPIVDIELEVRPLDAPAFTLEVTKVLAFTEIAKYIEGSLIDARYDPAEPDTVALIGLAKPTPADSPE